MRKIYSLLLLAMFTVSGLMAQIVTNGGFDDATGWTVVDCGGTAPVLPTYGADDDATRPSEGNGKYAIWDVNGDYILYQTIQLKVGSSYTFSGAIRGISEVGHLLEQSIAPAADVTLENNMGHDYWPGTKFKYQFGKGWGTENPVVGVDGTWQDDGLSAGDADFVAGVYTVPSSLGSAGDVIDYHLMVRAYGQLSIAIDEFVVEEIIVATTIVKNGGCASSDDWTIIGEDNVTLAWGDATVPTGATSATSVKIDYGVASWGEVQISQLVTLKKGKVYSLSANVKTTDNNHLEKWAQGFILDHDVVADGDGKYTDNMYPGRDTVKLLSLTNYGNPDDFSVDGAFPKVGDYGPCAETFVATADAATYPVLFKFGGNVPLETVYLTDITVTELRDAAIDATLSDLTVDASTVTGFDAATMSYNVELVAGTTDIPVVAAVETDDNASSVITQATALPGSATVVVTAEDRLADKTYTVNFTVATSIADVHQLDISVYPNPVNGAELNLVLNSSVNNISVNIYDISGKIVYSNNLSSTSGQYKINGLDNFEKGIYILKISDSNDSRVLKIQF